MSRNRARSRARALSIFSDSAITLDFIPIAGTAPALDPRITFTRSTTGTYVNSAGLITSAAINEPRFDYDPVTRALKGLLIEEQRTNLLTYSEQFDNAAWTKTNSSVTANSIVAPDGTLTADTLVEDTNTGSHETNQAATLVAATTYALSVYAKASSRTRVRLAGRTAGSWSSFPSGVFDLLAGTIVTSTGASSAVISDVGNGWYRCTIFGTTSATSAGLTVGLVQSGTTSSYTGDGTSGLYIWGAQLETGTFPTSYIPTTAATATRAADLASMTGTNFSSWYNQTEGTIYLQAQCLAAITAQTYLAIDNGTSNNLITVRTSPSNATFERSQVVDGGVTQAALGASGYVATSINDFAFAYKANDFARSFNGSSVSTDTSGTIPTVNQMFIGSERGQYSVNGHIRRIVYYPTRLSNDELRALTSYSRNVPLWTPAQISTALWLDAADASTITLNGSTVSQWNDKSGNGRNMLQATASAQPTWNATGLNSKPTLTFDGTSDFMLGTSNIGLSGNPLFSIAGVFITPLPSANVFLSFGSAAAASSYHFMGANSANNVWTGFSNGSQLGTATLSSPSSAYVFTTVRNDVNTANWTATQNGNLLTVTQGNSTAITLVDGPINLARFVSNTNFASMTAAEIVLVPTTLSTDNRQKLEGYLAWKWGLQANLPVDHPYKNAPPLL